MSICNDSSSFLAPETRCDYFISAEMKALWKTQLDILAVVDAICRKHDIRYCLFAGSLLGAVRHKGFIPWDDDIDIAMPRKEYERFLEIAPKELPAHLFLQNSLTDPEWRSQFSRVCNSNTLCVATVYVRNRVCFNMGVSIDVFPLDGVPRSRFRRKMLCALARMESLLRRERFRHCRVGALERVVCRLARPIFEFIGNARLYRWRERLFSRYDVDKTGFCTTAPARWGYREDEMWPTAWFKEMVDAPFEYLTVRIPKMAIEILDHEFGDWHKFVKFAGDHGEIYFDANRSYREVLVEKFGYGPDEIVGNGDV